MQRNAFTRCSPPWQEVFLADQWLCIAMECAGEGSLSTYVRRVGRLPEETARWFFQQLIFAVDYSHRKRVINRDIKPDNLLLVVGSKQTPS